MDFKRASNSPLNHPMTFNISGLVAAPFTPFDHQGNLNLSMISKLHESLRKNRISGAFICGTTGEGPSLTHVEKMELLHEWGRQAADTVKKIFMVGGTSVREMQELAQLSEKEGMDAISLLSPYFFRPNSVDDLIEVCREIATAAPSLPIFYYHIPSLTNGHYSMMEFLEKSQKAIPNLVGIKYTNSNLFEFQECRSFADGKYKMLWGTDEALLAGLSAGAHGAVGSTYNYAAPLYHRIIALFEDGNVKQAQLLQNKSVQMVGLLMRYGGTRAGKAFMKIIGLDLGWFRAPLQPLSDELVRKLEQDLKAIGFFDFCSEV